MQKPISLEVDFGANAGYLESRSLGDGQSVTQVLGIELLGFDDEALGAARHFAEQHDLDFPELLTRTGPR
jgi:hypothetical protein